MSIKLLYRDYPKLADHYLSEILGKSTVSSFQEWAVMEFNAAINRHSPTYYDIIEFEHESDATFFIMRWA